MMNTNVSSLFSSKIPLKDAPFAPLFVPVRFGNFHFYSKIDGTRKTDRSDRQWQAIQQLMPPLHQGRGIPSRLVFVPQKIINLHANLAREFHRLITSTLAGIVFWLPRPVRT